MQTIARRAGLELSPFTLGAENEQAGVVDVLDREVDGGFVSRRLSTNQ
jgi:hypothetical protein